jgi:predicted ATPase with chaperone activity
LHHGVLFLDRFSEYRRTVRRAAHLIEQAEAPLEEASGVIASGYRRLDP